MYYLIYMEGNTFKYRVSDKEDFSDPKVLASFKSEDAAKEFCKLCNHNGSIAAVS
jgi:hypothetical protein